MATIKKSAKKYATGGTVTTETTKPVSSKRVEFKKTKFDKNIEKTNKGVASGVRAKSGTTMKKAKSGFAALAPPYDKATFADKIAGAKANAGKAKSGTKMKKAQMGNTMMAEPMMKAGGKMKKCKYGCK